MTKEQLKNRTKEFSLNVFKFLMSLEKSKAVDVISYQLFKSSSSVAANYRAVCRGKSSSDFLNTNSVLPLVRNYTWKERISSLRQIKVSDKNIA